MVSYIFVVVIQQASASSRHHNHFPPLPNSNNNNFVSTSPSIKVCCAWDTKFGAGQLTYIIIGGDASSKRAIVEALNEWTSNVNGLQFTEVSDKNSADITLNFQNGGGGGSHKQANGLGSVSGSGRTDIVGETILQGSNGLIHSVQITIATAAFGSSLGTSLIKQIAMHEIGHALGIGHANFKGDIMAPAINYEKVAISSCDVNAVSSANQWKLVNSGTAPEPPQLDHVNC
jgi:Matrixin